MIGRAIRRSFVHPSMRESKQESILTADLVVDEGVVVADHVGVVKRSQQVVLGVGKLVSK